MTYTSALSTLNTPWITGSLGVAAAAGFAPFERACLNGSVVALPLLKVLNLLAISLSFYAATQPGRLDGQSSHDAANKEMAEFMSLRRGGTLVAPKGWAFLIWAPIFLGEFLFAATSLVAVRDGTAMAGLLRKVSSGFILAQVFQSLWAATFRPKYVGRTKPVTTWMSAGMLTGIAACLNQAHSAYTSRNKSLLKSSIYFLPISLHFGWTTAAALVNWNGNLAVTVESPQVLAIAGWTSVVIATAVGVAITLQRSAPVYGSVICWALAACADGMSDRLDERDRLLAQVQSSKSNWGFGKQSLSPIDEVMNRKGQYGALLQKWLCTVGAVLSGAAAVWTTIQPQQPPTP
jgi:hypothetical protein